MRFSAVILFFYAISFTASLAQTEQGRWQLGAQLGNLRYRNEGEYSTKDFGGTIAPSAGYFIARNLVIGAGVPVSYSSSRLSSDNYKWYQLVYGVSPFINYYIGNKPLKPYVGFSYAYNKSVSYSRSFSTSESTYRGHSTVISPRAGVAYWVTRNVALNAGLSFNIQHSEGMPTTPIPMPVLLGFTELPDSRYFSLDFGFQLYFGK